VKTKLADIRPNPFRNFDRNPLNPQKIDSLKASIHETGFWDNVVIRVVKGEKQAAYGHHRLKAALEAGIVEADLIVRDLTDAQMIQVMDDDNNEVYSPNDLRPLAESIEAVVSALDKSLIPAFKHAKDIPHSALIYAPSFIPGKVPSGQYPEGAFYTMQDIACFLPNRTFKDRGKRYPKDSVKAVFKVLRNIELQVPGWTRQSLLWPVKDILKAAESQEKKAAQVIENAKTQRIQTEKQRKEIEKLKEVERVAAEESAAEERRLRKEIDEAYEKEAEAKAKRIKEELAQKEKENSEREKRIAEYNKKEKELAKTEKKQREAEAKAAAVQEQHKAEIRKQRIKTLGDWLRGLFAESDPHFAEAKSLRLLDEISLRERQTLYLAAGDAASRLTEFAWGKPSPSAKQDKALKNLKEKTKDAKRNL